jgi:hypothetical protein
MWSFGLRYIFLINDETTYLLLSLLFFADAYLLLIRRGKHLVHVKHFHFLNLQTLQKRFNFLMLLFGLPLYYEKMQNQSMW